MSHANFEEVLPHLHNALSARKHSLDKSLLAVNLEGIKGFDTARLKKPDIGKYKRKSTVADLNQYNRLKREAYAWADQPTPPQQPMMSPREGGP